MRITRARCGYQPWLAEPLLGITSPFVLSTDLIGYERPGQQCIVTGMVRGSTGSLITTLPLYWPGVISAEGVRRTDTGH